jgi:V8-like Glu-specific endopeptidase
VTGPPETRVSNAAARAARPPLASGEWGEPEPTYGDDAATDPAYQAWVAARRPRGDAEPVGPAADPGDVRRRVVVTDQVPWRWVCSLRMVWVSSPRPGEAARLYPASGTGWLIGRRTVVTAGHNLYVPTATLEFPITGWARRVEVYFGRDEGSRGSTHLSEDLHSVLGWTRDANREYDYGVIQLTEPVERAGCFGYRVESDDRLRNLTYTHVIGYPGADRPPGTLWGAFGKVEVRPRVLRYAMATSRGQSGGPVFYKNQDDRVAVGIHTGKPAGPAGEPNQAVRVTRDVSDNLRAWETAADPPPDGPTR